MNIFDKFCAVIAFALGIVMLILGVIGTFIGCEAHFTLPPILGILPLFFGWGIVRAIYFGWQFKKEATSLHSAARVIAPASNADTSAPPE